MSWQAGQGRSRESRWQAGQASGNTTSCLELHQAREVGALLLLLQWEGRERWRCDIFDDGVVVCPTAG